MDAWKIKLIYSAINEHKKDEIRKFMVAYAELQPKYHGYLQSLPQNVQVWWEEADAETLKDLQKEFTRDKIGQWGTPKKKLYYKTAYPYLGVDGHLAMFNDKHPKGSIELKLTTLGDKTLIKAVASTGEGGVFEGMVELGDELDKSIGSAIRKALTYTGDGRFPTHKTEYGNHPMIIKFREFLEKENLNA